MLKRTISLLVIVFVLLAIPVCADMRTVIVYPDLTFANREATCFVEIQADKLTDTISATMELWQGTTKINEWSDSGTLYLSMEETATAKRYRTYSLVINYSINGVSKTPVTISRYYS